MRVEYSVAGVLVFFYVLILPPVTPTPELIGVFVITVIVWGQAILLMEAG